MVGAQNGYRGGVGGGGGGGVREVKVHYQDTRSNLRNNKDKSREAKFKYVLMQPHRTV